MGDCIYTKLKGASNNNDLYIKDALTIDVYTLAQYTENDYLISIKGISKLKIIGQGSISVNNGALVYDEIDNLDVSSYLLIKFTPGNYRVACYNKYNISGISYGSGYSSSNKGLKVHFDELDYNELKSVYIKKVAAFGEFKPKDVSVLDTFVVENDHTNISDFALDIDTLANANALENLSVYNTASFGKINNLASCTNVTTLALGNSGIAGELEVFATNMANSRNSGTITIYPDGSRITYNGVLLSLQYIASQGGTNKVLVNFTGSGNYTVSFA